MSAQPAPQPPSQRPWVRRHRRLLVGLALLTLAGAAGYWVYTRFYRSAPLAERPGVVDTGEPLISQEAFDQLAERDPVAMLHWCLIRYKRQVPGGMRCTLQKQERVRGEPAPPADPPVEVIELCVRGDTTEGSTEVRMKWRSGARKAAGSEILGTLFSLRPEADGGLGGKIVTWRPKAFVPVSPPVDANTDAVKKYSRYYIRDAGLYGALLRSHTVWSRVQADGELRVQYLGRQRVEQAGGRECHVIRRTCPRVEVDSFEIKKEAERTVDPKVLAAEGFNEVTLYIDVERWLQVGSVLERVEPDGTRVLIGAYYFRDIELNPPFAPDTFTTEGLKTP